MTELRRRLEWRESELDALFQGGPLGLALFDAELRHVRINDKLASLNGHAVREHVGCTLRQMVPEVAGSVEPKLVQVLATGKPVLDEPVTRPVAEPVFAEVSYVPVLLGDRTVRGVAAIVNDVSELRRAQTAVAEQTRFERILAELAARLASAPAARVDATIREALEVICNEFGLVRGSVVGFSDDGGILEPTHEWGAGTKAMGTQAREAERQWLRMVRAELLRERPAMSSGWRSSDAPVAEGHAPPSLSTARRHCERAGLQGSLAVPISGRGVRGAVVFHADEAVPVISDAGSARLTVVAQMILDALAARVAEEERQAAIAHVRQVRESMPPAPPPRDGEDGDDPVRLVTTTEGLRQVVRQVEAVASTDATVLLHGESGVGKELLAHVLHSRSRRSGSSLVKVNCASVPRELFESHFFGHVKGAFTGAHRDRVGRFELAHGGTLFLDEVGEIPTEMQAKLLRVLQEGELERVGDDRTRRVDVRLVVATNRDLDAEVRAGRFRRDLYHRLNVFPLVVPPLRERREDIVPLARYFLDQHARAAGRPTFTLTPAHERLLLDYDWPGNVRELSNVVQRAVILSPEPPLRLDLALKPAPVVRTDASDRAFLTEAEIRDRERQNLVSALESVGWRVSGRRGAAALLGMAPSTLRDRMKSLGIRRPR
ncbi:MAG: sigma 54-interacting transcriptional regulator [Myxococcota bacterium]